MNASQVLAAVRQRGWRVSTRPFELNIVGLRSAETKPNSFDDLIAAIWFDASGKLQGRFYPATTDPGTYWLRQPMNPQGTAILAGGQFVDSHAIGLHRGQYEALVQRGTVAVIRDYDRDAVLDFANGHEISGHFGINIHHASFTGTSATVDKWSAGCQVFADINDFREFMALCRRHREFHGNKFTYTLLDARAISRGRRRRRVVAIALMAVGLAAISAIAADHLPRYKARRQKIQN